MKINDMKVKDETLRVWSWRIFVAWFISVFMIFCWVLVGIIEFLH